MSFRRGCLKGTIFVRRTIAFRKCRMVNRLSKIAPKARTLASLFLTAHPRPTLRVTQVTAPVSQAGAEAGQKNRG
jgi:hypothetical protein